MREHSPFAVATAEAPPAPAQASFAANWFVSGIARLGDDNFVTIKSRDLATQFSLFAGETDLNGVSLASVNWTDAVGKSTVILRKGTETAKLEFNEEAVRAAPQSTPAPPKSGVPGPGLGMPPKLAQPPRLPGQNPPGGAPPPAGAATPAVHRRMQVIQPPSP